MAQARQSSFHEIEKSVLTSFAKWGNLVLLAGVTCLIAILILPLPPFILDFLLALNMVASLSILIMSLFIGNALQFSTFPGVLLVITLFRLSLNIASTRLILKEGEAGSIIHTFGEFVMGGQIFVGFVVFIITTLIQFIVVAKGSERVAEVAARFSLDAMPGRQMSIDADLRAGLITQSEAKSQREKLSSESRLFGAMDGTMKFVKGDTIAGLIIIAINLIGGIFVGFISRGLSFNEAIQTYAILSVGDGLVAQIPALFISLAAGLVVTKVNSHESGEKTLGQEMGFQFFSKPQVLLSASFISLFVGLIPGFPFFAFLILSAALGTLAFILSHTIRKKMLSPLPLETWIVSDNPLEKDEISLSSNPLLLEMSPAQFSDFKTNPSWVLFFSSFFPQLKTILSEKIGVPLPDCTLRVNANLQNDSYNIYVHDSCVETGNLRTDKITLVRPSLDLMKELENPEWASTSHGTPLALFSPDKKDKALTLPWKTPDEMLARHLVLILKKYASEFLGLQEVKTLLLFMEEKSPDLVSEVVPKSMSIQKLSEILKRLVEEQIPIRNLKLILEILASHNPENKDIITLTEIVRAGLKRTITNLVCGHTQTLEAVVVDGDLEEEIRKSIQKKGNDYFLAIDPEKITQIKNQYNQFCKHDGLPPPTVLTTPDIRRFIHKILEPGMDNLYTLSPHELLPHIEIREIGKLEMYV